MARAQPLTLVAGVDGCKAGWVAVILRDGRFQTAGVFPRLLELTRQLPHLHVIAVDIPIGLPAKDPRRADVEARRFIGPRRSSVFLTPPRPVLEARSYGEARRICRQAFGRGVTAQSYALRGKILEAEEIARSDGRLIEVHPEVSFRALAGRALEFAKRTWNGQMERRRLLSEAEIVLPDRLPEAGKAAPDDVVDAAAAAWSAHRFACGEAGRLPPQPESESEARTWTIWY